MYKNDIPIETAYAAFRNTSMNPRERAERTIEGYSQNLEKIYDEWKTLAESNGTEDVLQENFDRFHEGYKKRFVAWLHAQSRCFSVLVTGGSNFDNRAHEKANNSERNKLNELTEWFEKVTKAIENKLCPSDMIRSGSADEIQLLQEKLSGLEKRRNEIKEANKQYKKEGKGHLRSEPYVLQNLGQNIRSVKKRLESAERRQSMTSADYSGIERETPEYKIFADIEENRLKIEFTDKPSKEVCGQLKKNGWKWSPSNCAWQRFLHTARRYHVEDVEKIING